MVSSMANNEKIIQGTLIQRTRWLLRADPRGVLEVHKASGLPFYWLRKIYAGEINDPGVNRIQKLYEFLSGETLTVK